MQQGDPSEIARAGENEISPIIGQPLGEDAKALRRSGRLHAFSDLVWILQAGLIALALGTMLTAVTGRQEAGNPVSSAFVTQIAMSGIGIVCLAALRVWLQYVAANLSRRTARSIQDRTRQELLAAAVRRSPAAEFPSSGAFAAHVTEQVDLLGPYYSNFVPQMTRLKLVPASIVLATVWISWLAAAILLICGPLIPVFMALIGTKAKAASARQQEELTRLSGTLLDRIRGLETLTLFGALGQTARDIETAGETFRTGTMRVLKIAFLSSTVLELFSALGIAFCAVYVGFSLLGDIRVGTWGTPLGYSTGLFVLLLAPEFFAPLRAYATAYHDRAAGLAAQEKLASLFHCIHDDASSDLQIVPSACVQAELKPSPPAVTFDRIGITLADYVVFDGFDLRIEPGETVLLSGRSGSGKTTLLDCLLGFLKPVSGRIDVGGVVPHVTDVMRSKVVWLGQSPRLFHGSLRANLLKGAPDADAVSESDLWAALKLAGAEGLVRRLPQGLATPLGEDGFGLSVGEIRRIALARAALRRDARLLLADEPTAGLDEETAADVIRGLKALALGRTSIIATHDAALLRIPGRRIDLDDAKETMLEEAAP